MTEHIKDGEKLIRACYMAAVYAPLDALDEADLAVRAICGQGWRVNAEGYAQLPSCLACLPMTSAGGLDADLQRMGRMKTLLTSSAVNLAPQHGERRGQPANPDNPPALSVCPPRKPSSSSRFKRTSQSLWAHHGPGRILSRRQSSHRRTSSGPTLSLPVPTATTASRSCRFPRRTVQFMA